jgi:carboxypeptidase C (cathepsin A)
MREYKMGRGEYLDDRVPDPVATIEDYFGPVTGTAPYEGQELHAVEDPDNPVFERVVAGAMRYEDKKDTLAVDFVERDAETVIAEGHADAAADAVDAKNDFLLEVTGRDAESRRKSMKRAVEDDTDVPDAA